MGRCDGLEFIWERVPQTTSFKFDRSLPQGTMCLFKMKVLSIERVLYTLEGSRSMHGPIEWLRGALSSRALREE